MSYPFVSGPSAIALAAALLVPTVALGQYQSGDDVVVVEVGSLILQNQSVDEVEPGLVLTVQEVKGVSLRLSGKSGWLDHRKVVPLDRAAIDRLSELIRADPSNRNLYTGRAEVWRHLGEFQDAIADLSEVIRLNPSAEAYCKRGHVWLADGKIDKALADCDEAIRLDPKFPLAYYSRGHVWGKTGQTDKALEDFNEVVRLDSKSAVAYTSRGYAWFEKGEFDKALADCDEAVRLDPKLALAYYYRGLVWAKTSQTDKALEDFNEALRLNRKFAPAYTDRGRAWSRSGDYDKAIADFNDAVRLDPKYALAYHNRGLMWLFKGSTEKAVVDLNEGLRLDSENSGAYYVRAIGWMILRDPRAVEGFQKTIDLQGAVGNQVPYAVIMGHFATRLLKLDARDDQFLPNFTITSTEKWPSPIIEFLQGKLDATELLHKAANENQRTEVECYLGLQQLVNGKSEAALAHFRWVKEHGNKSYFEYPIVLGELDRLAKDRQ